MDVIKITHHQEEFLFNGRAYMSIDNSTEMLLELERELETIGKEYLTILQLRAMYDFHKDRGLPASTVSLDNHIPSLNLSFISISFIIFITLLTLFLP